jgi:hypothetical protein
VHTGTDTNDIGDRGDEVVLLSRGVNVLIAFAM